MPQNPVSTALVLVLVTAQPLLAEDNGPESAHPRWSPSVASIGSRNLIPNASFESGPDRWSTLGKPTAWGGDLTGLFGEVRSDEAWHGRHCLGIELGPGKTPVTHFNAWPLTRVVQTAPLAANVGWLSVDPGKTYTLSAYLRADRPDVQAKLVFRFGTDQRTYASPSTRAKAVTLSAQWERYSFTLESEERDVCIALGPDLSAEPESSATVWIDAVQLEAGPAPTPFTLREPVEIGIDSGRPGNVFDAGDSIALTVHGFSTLEKETTVEVEARLTDYFDLGLPVSSVTIEIPPAGTASESLPLKVPGKGFYRARLTWKIGEVEHSRALDLAVIKPYPWDDSPFGINLAPPTPQLCAALKKVGVVWAREWSLDWNQLEPVEGQLSFALSDQHIDRILAAGMRPMALLPPFPSASWASEAPDDLEKNLPDSWHVPPSWARLAYAPKDPRKLSRYVRQAAQRYKNRIHVWEFLNEPINTAYSLPSSKNQLPGADYGVADYLNLLTPAYRAMKEVDPACKVLGGICVGQLDIVLEQTRQLVELGGLEYLDLYNLHPYGLFADRPEGFVPFLETLNRHLDAAGKGPIPVWITECGYHAEDDKPWDPWVAPKGHFSATHLLANERVGADYVIRYALIMLAHRVEKIFYHQGCEGEVNNGSFDLENPLLGPLATPQKLYAAHSALANLLGPEPKYAGAIANPASSEGQATESVYAYAFQCGDRALVAAWIDETTTDDFNLGIEIPRGTDAFNIVGLPLSARLIRLGPSPVYLVSRSRTAKELLTSCSLKTVPSSESESESESASESESESASDPESDSD